MRGSISSRSSALKLEGLCRHVSPPPIAEERLARTSSGPVRYRLKSPYRDGTTHFVMEPLDLMARLAARVPSPRMHLRRFHGVFAPHSKLRAEVRPAHRGMGGKGQGADQAADKPATPRHVAMNGARRLERVFGVQIESCAGCGGKLKILAHLEKAAPDQSLRELPLGARAPPIQARLI